LYGTISSSRLQLDKAIANMKKSSIFDLRKIIYVKTNNVVKLVKLSLTKFFILLFIISIPFSVISQSNTGKKDRTERINKRTQHGDQKRANKKLRKQKKKTKKVSKYSVDKQLKNRNGFFKRLFASKEVKQKRKEDRQARKIKRKEAKVLKKKGKVEQRRIKKYQKTRNEPDYVHTKKDAYKTMKKTKRTQKRQFKGKNRDPWVKRIFQKKHERDKVKRGKEDRARQFKEPFFKKLFKRKKRKRKT